MTGRKVNAWVMRLYTNVHTLHNEGSGNPVSSLEPGDGGILCSLETLHRSLLHTLELYLI